MDICFLQSSDFDGSKERFVLLRSKKAEEREREREREGKKRIFFLVTRKSGVRLKRLIWPLIV